MQQMADETTQLIAEEAAHSQNEPEKPSQVADEASCQPLDLSTAHTNVCNSATSIDEISSSTAQSETQMTAPDIRRPSANSKYEVSDTGQEITDTKPNSPDNQQTPVGAIRQSSPIRVPNPPTKRTYEQLQSETMITPEICRSEKPLANQHYLPNAKKCKQEENVHTLKEEISLVRERLRTADYQRGIEYLSNLSRGFFDKSTTDVPAINKFEASSDSQKYKTEFPNLPLIRNYLQNPNYENASYVPSPLSYEDIIRLSEQRTSREQAPKKSTLEATEYIKDINMKIREIQNQNRFSSRNSLKKNEASPNHNFTHYLNHILKRNALVTSSESKYLWENNSPMNAENIESNSLIDGSKRDDAFTRYMTLLAITQAQSLISNDISNQSMQYLLSVLSASKSNVLLNNLSYSSLMRSPPQPVISTDPSNSMAFQQGVSPYASYVNANLARNLLLSSATASQLCDASTSGGNTLSLQTDDRGSSTVLKGLIEKVRIMTYFDDACGSFICHNH